MCGGAGTRLWPVSRPSRPKQFMSMGGDHSLFQEAVLRAVPLADGGGRVIVVGGVDHKAWILDQLEQIEADAQVLLEPEARESAAAMAAAAIWTHDRDPNGVNVFIASDHHIPDHQGFRAAVLSAVEGARQARIVTLGIKPNEPSSAYGYIAPTGQGLSPIAAFVEKPEQEQALQYIRDGYLWNSGNFIVASNVLLSELRAHAPEIEGAVRHAVETLGRGTVGVLGDAFRQAPKVSIDYALMEKTSLASVLEVNFNWSDLGAWDAIAASGQGEAGELILEDVDGCLTRAADGMLIAAVGVQNLAIIAEPDAVLVCDLSRSQDVKKVVERIRVSSPQHADFARRTEEPLDVGSRRLQNWLRRMALPTWATLGQREDGAFVEALGLNGRRLPAPRRARVQARQIFVFAQAGLMGWQGPWVRAVRSGMASLETDFLREDGLMRTLLDAQDRPLDEAAMVYDQAFYLLALATAAKSGAIDGQMAAARGVAVRDALETRAVQNGAFREAGAFPFQSNAHMHLLEAALAWDEVSDDPAWGALADRLAILARTIFIDPTTGRLGELLDGMWRLESGERIEPGHQFEWAWLLARHARLRGEKAGMDVARRLYVSGRDGVSQRYDVAIDALNGDGSVRISQARLWPQTEWLKASLFMAREAGEADRVAYMGDAAAALRALWMYLTPDGLWRDKKLQNGSFVEEEAPASSLYHIVSGFVQLAEFSHLLDTDTDGVGPLG
ncbi:AGE family epimerase/isomerase [Brevundimonas sp. NPDC090276]|uniref:AGE family epimerase/isomerase n=1 Tax=Brevundimonas sp. NPDC090276 TaxID=3363956 RepID=UPI00383BC0AE